MMCGGCGKKEKVKSTRLSGAAAIEAMIRKGAEKPEGELTKADFEKVKYIVVTEKQITDLTPFAELTELKDLNLSGNQITDLTPLSGLTKLETLKLAKNNINDLKPLEKLKALKELSLYNNYDLTKAKIGKLQRKLKKCEILDNTEK